MTTSKKQLILALCDSWWNAACLSGSGIGIGESTEKYRLLNNGIRFHELDYEEITATAIGLNKVLLHPGFNAVISDDHVYFWAWISQVIFFYETGYFPIDKPKQGELRDLFETIIRAMLSDLRPQATDKESWKRSLQVLEQINFNSKELIYKTHLILGYLVFPLLEATVKRRCNAYVDYSGMIMKPFTAKQTNGEMTSYAASGKGRKRCSSIHDLLFLLYDRVADKELQENLNQLQLQAHDYSSGQSFFDLIYEWRNSSLHGSSALLSIGSTILNLIVLISVDEIKGNYNKLRKRSGSL